MEYHNIDGTGWPDAVVVDNGGDIFEHAYETRTYFPVDRNALLSLADEIMENADLSRELHDEMLNEKRLDMALTFHEYACELREYASRIREALGVDDG